MIATLTGTMRVVCYWCHKEMGTKPCSPDQDGTITTSLHPECKQQQIAEAKAEKNQPRKSGDPCYNRWQEEGARSAGFTWDDERTYIERDRRRVINQEWW